MIQKIIPGSHGNQSVSVALSCSNILAVLAQISIPSLIIEPAANSIKAAIPPTHNISTNTPGLSLCGSLVITVRIAKKTGTMAESLISSDTIISGW
jgi:hypothetical protein